MKAATIITIHPENPQLRLVKQVVAILNSGGLAIVPTDTAYAMVCTIDNSKQINKICQIKQLPKNHNFTIMCSQLRQVSELTRIDNPTYKVIKRLTPGAYTFVLAASAQTPKKLQSPKKRTIGIRIPDNNILNSIFAELAQPLLTSTLKTENSNKLYSDPDDIATDFINSVDVIVAGGVGFLEETTVLDFSKEGNPELLRKGLGVYD